MELIRKIVVGTDPLKGLAYVIGQDVGRSKIDAIVFDERYLSTHGKERYNIYIKDSRGIMLWKRIQHQSVIVEFSCEFN
jgi:hypothetical protein